MILNNLLTSLRRVTSRGDFIPEIDGLRFLAIFPVVLMHANTNYNRVFDEEYQIDSYFFNYVINQGGKGVWIFFAISGFILSLFFAKHFQIDGKRFNELKLKGYFIRRLTRLEPPFLISTCLLFFATGLFIQGSLAALIPNFFASITYMHNIVYGKWSPINPVTWSLEIEVQFYLLAPFLCGLLFSLKETTRNLILVFAIIILPFIVLDERSVFVNNIHFKRTLPIYFHHFLVGILLTSVYTGSYWRKIKEKFLFWDGIALIMITIMLFLKADIAQPITFIIFDLCLFFFMIATFKGRYINWFFTRPLITTVGGMCYSIYLIHYAVTFGLESVINNITFQSPVVNYLSHMAISLFVVLLLSIVFFKLFERPFMNKNWPVQFKDWLIAKFKFVNRTAFAAFRKS